MNRKRQGTLALQSFLNDSHIRRASKQEQTLYAAEDIVAFLTNGTGPWDLWQDLKRDDRQLSQFVEPIEFASSEGNPATIDGLSLEGIFRLVMRMNSPQADRLKDALAKSAAQHLRESENPELLALRARKLYEQKGYSRRWVDKRLRGISARQELTSEWYKRGATESDDYRTLTNELMRNAFGMDVEAYRRYKHLAGANQNLRDHMSDLELALTSLAETAAVALHQARDSHGRGQLEKDAVQAGRIVAQTRKQIERRSGRPVVNPRQHRLDSLRNRHPGSAAELAKPKADMHNSSPSHPVRSVA